eukprot:Polyplicarium_translucidae@DN382_c0_g1_i1.p4
MATVNNRGDGRSASRTLPGAAQRSTGDGRAALNDDRPRRLETAHAASHRLLKRHALPGEPEAQTVSLPADPQPAPPCDSERWSVGSSSQYDALSVEPQMLSQTDTHI